MSRDDAERVSAALLASYAGVWAEVQARQAAILDARKPQRAARQLAAFASDEMDSLDGETRDWLANDWSLIYAQGATDADPNWTWDDDSIARATLAADELYTRLYGATSGVVRTTTRLARTTPWDTRMASRQFADVLRQHGAAAVVYRNGARHGLADYAEKRIKTSTSLAYNDAMITAGKSAGAQWFECKDGPQCGLDGHFQGDRADGLIETADFAAAHLISHERCVRTWNPRFDITDADQAKAVQAETQASNNQEVTEQVPTRGGERLAQRLAARERRLVTRSKSANV